MSIAEHANLRALIIQTDEIRLDVLRQVFAMRIPNLEHLELWLTGSDTCE